MNLLDVLNRLVAIAPDVTLRDALAFVEALSATDLDLTTHDGRLNFARAHSGVQAYIRSGNKIAAIKELRTAIRDAGQEYPHAGLVAAKNVIDELMPPNPW